MKFTKAQYLWAMLKMFIVVFCINIHYLLPNKYSFIISFIGWIMIGYHWREKWQN